MDDSGDVMHPLRRWRHKKQLSLEALGAQLGVNRSTLSYYETGNRIPRPPIMERIRRVTEGEVTASDFYPREAAE